MDLGVSLGLHQKTTKNGDLPRSAGYGYLEPLKRATVPFSNPFGAEMTSEMTPKMVEIPIWPKMLFLSPLTRIIYVVAVPKASKYSKHINNVGHMFS